MRYDTKLSNADKLKILAEKPYIKPGTINQMMHERLEEGLHTKIPKENKGYQLLMRLGFKEGSKLGKETAKSAI